MSAAGSTEAQVLDPCQVGEISAAWQVAPDALLLLGWQRDQPSSEGTVALQRASGEGQGRFQRLAWQPGAAPGASGEAFRFLAAVRLPPRAAVQGGDTLLLTARAEREGVLARLPPRFLDAAPFAGELARAASGAAAPLVARFLTVVFAPAAVAADPATHAMVASFLDRVSESDGCVEIVGAIRDRCAYMQGWGRPLDPACDVLLAGATIQRHQARTASFARSDIAAPATGQALVLPPLAAQAGTVANVFILGRTFVRRRPVLAGHQTLSEQEMVGHIRDVLPVLRCDAATRAVLAASLRPRYEGRFTLHDSGHPVRLGVDLAASAKDGAYLTGWLYDPVGVVEAVHLRGTRSAVPVRLNDTWTRIPREDVTNAFRGDPSLPPAIRHDHGFAVHAAIKGGASDEAFYLDVAFRDGACGFVPLVLTPAVGEAAQAKLLASVDLHKASGLTVIERQLAPFLATAAQQAAPVLAQPAAPVLRAWSSAIVVPLPQVELPRAFLAQFLRDPLARHEGVLFACGDDWTEAHTAALDALAQFYGVACAILRVDGTATASAALDAAVRRADAERFLLLGPGTVGRAPGWRRRLEAAWRAQGGTACLSPTVLYEDDSIRFAGFGGVEALDAEPYVALRRRLAGMPANFAAGGEAAPGEPVPTVGPSIACCLIPRRALAGVGAGLPPGATPSEEEIALLLRLRAAGTPCAWLPSVQVHATEDAHAAPTIQERVGRLVSRWCLRARLAAEE